MDETPDGKPKTTARVVLMAGLFAAVPAAYLLARAALTDNVPETVLAQIADTTSEPFPGRDLPPVVTPSLTQEQQASVRTAKPSPPPASTPESTPQSPRSQSSPTATRSTTPAHPSSTAKPTAPSSVEIQYQVPEVWDGGYRAFITIHNQGERDIDGWTLRFRLPDTEFIWAWHAEVSTSGDKVTARNLDWNGEIEPGESVEFGFTAKGEARVPVSCRFNEISCAFR